MAKISARQLANYVVDELEKGSDLTVVAQQLAAYLLDSRQSRDLSKVIRLIEDELNSRGQSQVEIIGVHDVSDQIKQELANLLGASNPVFHTSIDKSVIGGVKARSGESEIDLTVRGRLNKFKAKLINSN